jgi:NAD/NADP transhydrogenase beta subunit
MAVILTVRAAYSPAVEPTADVSTAGLYAARTVKMTAMPQLVSVINAVGGRAPA